ncbi:MAG: hypothetical protein MUC28_02830 [Planctomycetes bacterium]|jgi:hypothetical protein|nr:hypothetical protein [Planctomycetota bacterium]
MAEDRGLEPLMAIIKNKRTKKPPAYEWQDLALRVISELGIPPFKRNSVFRICKIYPKPFVEKCLNDTKELCRRGETWRYFFKLASVKKSKNSKI